MVAVPALGTNLPAKPAPPRKKAKNAPKSSRNGSKGPAATAEREASLDAYEEETRTGAADARWPGVRV
jgi:hypothetical protein